MNETLKIIADFGLLGTIIVLLLVLGFKYLPQVFDLLIKRANEKNLMYDNMKSVIGNNTAAFRVVEKAIENNSIIVKQNTDNRHKLEEEIHFLREDFKRHDVRAEEMAQDLKIIKHK